MLVSRGQVDQQRNRNAAEEITYVDEAPGTQHLVRTNLAAGVRHDHQIVAGKKLGPADDDQDQAQREHQARQETGHAVGQDALCARRDDN